MKRAVTSLFVLTMLAASAAPARAAIPPLLSEATRPMWASFAFGPAIELDDLETQVKLIETFGYHFWGGAEGPAIAIDLQESFGNDFFTFELLPKFVWDIRIISGLGLYLSPSIGIGYAMLSPDCPRGVDCDSLHGMTIQIGFEGKLMFANRFMAFFRPFTIDIVPVHSPEVEVLGVTVGGGWETGVRWDMMFGGGVIF